jgi:hypothetical protein
MKILGSVKTYFESVSIGSSTKSGESTAKISWCYGFYGFPVSNSKDTQRFAYSAQLGGENDELGGIEKAEVMSGDEKDVDVIGARS